MTEPICICGHGKERHTGMSGDDRYCKEWVQRGEWTSHCPCENYRPILDWPDAPGWWWCNLFPSIVFAKAGSVAIQVSENGHDWWIRQELAPARFVRVLETETNPL
jgi:hypothetical protein